MKGRTKKMYYKQTKTNRRTYNEQSKAKHIIAKMGKQAGKQNTMRKQVLVSWF